MFALPLVPYLGFILISLERKERGTELKVNRQMDRQTDIEEASLFYIQNMVNIYLLPFVSFSTQFLIAFILFVDSQFSESTFF